MPKIKTEDKRLAAWLMFKEGIYTQEYISKTVGINNGTLSQWKIKFKWDEKRKSLLVTKEAQLVNLYNQLDALNESIKPENGGKGIPDSKQADIQVKLTSSINKLEVETSLAEISETGKRFLRYVSNNAPEQIKIAADLFNAFFLDYQKHVG